MASKTLSPGLAYVSQPTGQLRYSSDENKPLNWIQPLPTVIAATKIRKGQLISIATPQQREKSDLGDKFKGSSIVVPTDPRLHTYVLGIALEPAQATEEFHIQNNGIFIYKKDNDNNELYFPSNIAPNLGEYKKRVGSFVFAHINPGNTGNELIEFNGDNWADYTRDANLEKLGLITTQSKNYNKYKNVIRIGHLMDAPVVDNASMNEFGINISIVGDVRRAIALKRL